MTFYIAPVVEGHTEQQCVERLLHRIWNSVLERSERLQVLDPFRGKRDELTHANGLAIGVVVQRAYVNLLLKSRKETDCRKLVLILLDAESDCPAELAPRLLHVAKTAQANATVACVIAKRMFENWLIAGGSSLAGVHGLPGSMQIPTQIEDCNGAAWLSSQLHSQNRRRSYQKIGDALHFVNAFNLLDCRAKSPSFNKLCRDLEKWAQS